ncbi:MAG: response regulator [Methylocystaceae bacterium]|nr:response regulator [Methylocystaceae bacterium]
MKNSQSVTRVRRQYNQWVANQTLEDFALRFTAKKARKWSAFRVGNTALGAISFLALEAIGGAITLSYGFYNSFLAILVVSAILFLTALPIAYYAAKHGLDIDLLSRGAGFGYIGSTITSLIYASFTFIFFAIEAAIMSAALEMLFGIPLSVGYLISAGIVIPLVTHGITFISRLQLWTQPIWLLLHLLPFVYLGVTSIESFHSWTYYMGAAGETALSFNILLFGAASLVLFSLIAQIGEQVDFLRFLPEKTEENRVSWWFSMLMAGPGWIIVGGLKLIAGSFLAYYAISQMLAPRFAMEPSHMYLTAFQAVFSKPEIALAVTGIFVILSQIKINVTNAYAGSIAWSNFFSRLTHSHPGRVVWLVFNVVIAYLLMEMGIYKALEKILGMYSIIAVAWVGALVADLTINKPFGLSPPIIEFKRAHLYDINPVGVGSMLIATIVALVSYMGVFGETAQALASFIALGTAFICAPMIAYLTKGKYYLAREHHVHTHSEQTCSICANTFESEDMTYCPVYDGTICSLCCSLDARCHDNCKKKFHLTERLASLVQNLLPQPVHHHITSRVIHYFGVHLLIGIVIASVLLLLYFQTSLYAQESQEIISATLWEAFIILMIVSGVVSWLFVLARESRQVAEQESQRQTEKLRAEIEAHELTDAELQKAKEAADAANIAKSRYVTGLAHELRTPLNAIYGYAQLLEKNNEIPSSQRPGISVIRRNADHLAQLIDGISDISKIESGRLHLIREQINLVELLDQLEDIFGLQARNANIQFNMKRPSNLPTLVYTDGKRLKQILINLLTNAIKFTQKGSVTFSMTYRSEVAEFSIEDTGIGIPLEDRERIFQPFERGSTPHTQATRGIGLGLAITRVLTQVLGGEINVYSKVGRGSRFTVKLFLSEIKETHENVSSYEDIVGYKGARKTVLIADDTPEHRGLLEDVLTPLGFFVYAAQDGESALRILNNITPDLCLLDVSMPKINGWQLSRMIRKNIGHDIPIMMISANNRNERIIASGIKDEFYLMKPIVVPVLLEKIASILQLEWIVQHKQGLQDTHVISGSTKPTRDNMPPHTDREELKRLGEIGHVIAIRKKLEFLQNNNKQYDPFVEYLMPSIQRFEIKAFMTLLTEIENEHCC